MKKMRKVQIGLEIAIIVLTFGNVINNALGDNDPRIYSLCALVILGSVRAIMLERRLDEEENSNNWALRQIMKLLEIPQKDEK